MNRIDGADQNKPKRYRVPTCKMGYDEHSALSKDMVGGYYTHYEFSDEQKKQLDEANFKAAMVLKAQWIRNGDYEKRIVCKQGEPPKEYKPGEEDE
jgi:hypothetical protein